MKLGRGGGNGWDMCSEGKKETYLCCSEKNSSGQKGEGGGPEKFGEEQQREKWQKWMNPGMN